MRGWRRRRLRGVQDGRLRRLRRLRWPTAGAGRAAAAAAAGAEEAATKEDAGCLNPLTAAGASSVETKEISVVRLTAMTALDLQPCKDPRLQSLGQNGYGKGGSLKGPRGPFTKPLGFLKAARLAPSSSAQDRFLPGAS